MSELNSINGGYNGGSPRVRSENVKKIIIPIPTLINVSEMVENIKEWHADGKLSNADIQQLISELNKI